jgi:hypothetical protein
MRSARRDSTGRVSTPGRRQHLECDAALGHVTVPPSFFEQHSVSRPASWPLAQVRMDAEKNEVAVRMVKAQLERTTLGEVVESIRIVLTPSGAHVAVRLDASTLRRLHLRIDAFTVKAALIAAPKLKLTAAIVQCVSVALAASSLLWLGWTERRSLLK